MKTQSHPFLSPFHIFGEHSGGQSDEQRSKAESAIAFSKLVPKLRTVDIKILHKQKESKR